MSIEAPPPSRGRLWALALSLAALTALLYARATEFDFVNFDDPSYVYNNQAVLGGLSADGVAYAFRGEHSTNWHPLTTLSHMLDVELFGEDAGKHHLVSVLMHALNAALCFAALFALTRRAWTSLFVAALFAVHPLRVESVAWISERKDVLSGTFFFLTLIAWARYARGGKKGDYALAALALALGLMAKQMLVTLPCLLVLLDVWPLRRASCCGGAGRSVRQLVVEKLPLFAITVAAGVLAWMAQDSGGTIGSLRAIPIADRVANAFGAVAAYVRLSLAPTGLACFYPHASIVHPDDSAALYVPAAIGAVLVGGVTFLAWRLRRAIPAVLVGWLWFLGTLVPVVGLVQIGSQAWADRYTYLPTIGLAWMLVAVLVHVASARPALRVPIATLGGLAVAALGFGTWRQVPVWENSTTLHEHAVRVTEGNYVAHNNLGLARLLDDADPILAEGEFLTALEQNPAFHQAAFNLALAYRDQGRAAEAVATLERLLELNPNDALAARQLGLIRRAQGNADAALVDLRRATELDPTNIGAWLELGYLYLNQKEATYAEQCALRVTELDDNVAAGHSLLGLARQALGDHRKALEAFRRAVELAPESYEARHTLARELADTGQVAEAKAEVQLALELPLARSSARILLAKLLMFEGDEVGAQAQIDRVLLDDVNHPEANDVLGNILMNRRAFDEAEAAFRRALSSDAQYRSALANLGALLEQQKREAEAVELYERLLESDTESTVSIGAARGLAWIRATSPDAALRDGDDAVRWAEYVIQSTPAQDPSPNRFIVYAAAKAEAGKFEHAVEIQKLALERARNDTQRRSLQKQLDLYTSEQPYHRTR